MTDKDRLFTDSTNVHTVVEIASGKGQAQSTLISTRDSAHDFCVKFSPSVCVAVIDRRNSCNLSACMIINIW